MYAYSEVLTVSLYGFNLNYLSIFALIILTKEKKSPKTKESWIRDFYFQGKMIRISEHQLTRNYLLLSVRHVMESFN